MKVTTVSRQDAERRHSSGSYRFTPAQWRQLLEEPSFLQSEDNSYALPRRLNGRPVLVIPELRRDA